MSDTAQDEARRIAEELIATDVPIQLHEPDEWHDFATDVIAAALTAAEERGRKEGLEEAAKVADSHATGEVKGLSLGPNATMLGVAQEMYNLAAEQLATLIRALAAKEPT